MKTSIFLCTLPRQNRLMEMIARVISLLEIDYTAMSLINNTKLGNSKLLLEIPALPGPAHNGGTITIGPDNNLYIIIGNLNDREIKSFWTLAEKSKNASSPDGRAGILRLTQDGEPVDKHGILGDSMPLKLYYAYGIRNGFGLAFDPITGKLWDTENGPDYGDEINIVEPGFNSGWNKVQGIWERTAGFWHCRRSFTISKGFRGF